MRREQLDDLLLDEGRVDVEDDEAAATAGQAARCDRDVDALRRGDERELGAQGRHVGAGDVELDGRHGVARQPTDAVDVGAVVGDPGRDEGDGVRAERRAEDDDGGAPVPRARVDAGALDDGERQAEAVGGDRGGVAQLVDVRPGAQQDGERQVAVDDDLLDVEDLARRPRTAPRAASRSHRAGRLPSR